jgi:hypothetical protein
MITDLTYFVFCLAGSPWDGIFGPMQHYKETGCVGGSPCGYMCILGSVNLAQVWNRLLGPRLPSAGPSGHADFENGFRADTVS